MNSRLRCLSRCFLFTFALNNLKAEAASPTQPAMEQLSVAEFVQNRKSLVGLLGVPLGTVVEIEATIVAGSAMPENMPNLARTFLLSVEKGKPNRPSAAQNFHLCGAG
jgi:hypothetical protein